MPEGTEFSKWGVPQAWRKWIYTGALGISLVGNYVLSGKLEDCWDRNDALRDKSDLRLEKWVDKVMEKRLQEAETEKIDPKIEEVRGIADSLKSRVP